MNFQRFVIATLIIMGLGTSLLAEEIIYKGQTKSLIDWPNLDPYQWLDFQYWKREQLYRKKFPNWANVQRDKNHLEEVGRIIKCVGKCINERHDGEFIVGFYSKVYETNEVRTENDSYAWIFLMDGTLVRLSPNSSITFNEFNVSNTDFFIYSRMNYGNILWLSREQSELETQNLRETDSLFSLLLVSNVDDWLHREKDLSENDLFESLTRENYANQYVDLNDLIKKNNLWMSQKPTRQLLSMPNGIITGSNLSLEFVVLLGNKTYFKQRTFETYNASANETAEAEFFKLGFDEMIPVKVEKKVWYEVDFKGKEINEYSGDLLSSFNISELVTKRIPTVLTARELWLQKFSTDLFEKNIDKKRLREELGYRLWRSADDKDGDSYLRYEYLLKFVRKIETQSIGAYANYLEESKKEDFSVETMEYTPQYYSRAMNNYSIRKETEYWVMAKSDRKVLNSTRKKLWRIIHENTN